MPMGRKNWGDCSKLGQGTNIAVDTRDARLNTEGSGKDGGPSPEMQRLRKVFSRNHAMTIHLNLISIGAMVVYGWRLGSRLVVDSGSV